MSDTIQMMGTVASYDTPTGERMVNRPIAVGKLFSSTNQPAVNPMAVRNDPRILKHYQDNTLRMIEELAEIAYDRELAPGVRLSAISEYLTRAMGKPVQAIDLNLEDRRPVVVDGALSRLVEGLAEPTRVQEEPGKGS